VKERERKRELLEVMYGEEDEGESGEVRL